MTPSQTPGNGIAHLITPRPVPEVLEHLLLILKKKGIKLFTVIDHSGEASVAGLTMPDTKLVIFGSPKAGTPLMLAAPDIALDLPLKILIAATPDHTTRISYNTVAYLQSRFNLSPELSANITAIEQLAAALV